MAPAFDSTLVDELCAFMRYCRKLDSGFLLEQIKRAR